VNSSKAIISKQKTLARLERQYALEKVKERKRDTRRKIEFGGLIIKAKLNQYPKDVILGAMLYAVNHLESDEASYRLFQCKGEAAFMNYGDKDNG